MASTHSGAPICRRFQRGTCKTESCRYAHVCVCAIKGCQQSHGANQHPADLTKFGGSPGYTPGLAGTAGSILCIHRTRQPKPGMPLAPEPATTGVLSSPHVAAERQGLALFECKVGADGLTSLCTTGLECNLKAQCWMMESTRLLAGYSAVSVLRNCNAWMPGAVRASGSHVSDARIVA